MIRTYRIPITGSSPTAPTYVLLHGIGLSHRFFSDVGRALSRTGSVIAFDLAGFGSLPRPSKRVTVEDHAALVCRQLARLEAGTVVLIGHSRGAQIAIEVARRDPRLVSHLVVIGPVVDPARPSLRAQALGLLRDAVVEPPRTQAAVLFDYVRCGIPWFLAQARVMRDYPTHLRVLEVLQPLLVIRGHHDPIARASWSSRLSRQSSRGELVTIPGKRHNAPHSAPDATASAIIEFLSRL